MDRGQIPNLVRRLFGAYQSKDRQVVEELLSDDFTFTSPYDDHIDRTAYFERCWPNSDRIRTHRLERSSRTATKPSSSTIARPCPATGFGTSSA